MSEAYGDRLRAAFDEVSARPACERVAFLHATCGDDARLLADLLGMIEHLGADTSFLEPLAETDVRVLLGQATASSEWPDEAVPDLEGHVLAGRYFMGRRIGSGGASVVHEAHDDIQDRPVAVKVLRQSGRRSRRMLRREVSALRLLRLPGVVQLLDEGVEGNLAFLVTERVDGALFPGEPFDGSWAQLRHVAIALLEVLERMHRAGIAHGDLKPANVLVRPDRVPVILDLGIAGGPRSGARDPEDAARHGTLRYMAPEQVAGGFPTPRSDLYAVGVMLHEALTGEPYRSVPTVALARVGVVREAVKPLDADVPSSVRAALTRLLAHDAAERPASAAEALALLRAADEPRPRLRDLPPSAALEPSDLRPLFAGPDRLLHLREDGAVELWRRTGGVVERLAEELDAWSRAGLGYWEDGLYHLRRRDLEHLHHTGHPLAAPGVSAAAGPALSPSDVEMLAVVEVAGTRATAALLASTMRTEPEAIRDRLEAFGAGGLIAIDEVGTLRLPALPAAVSELLLRRGRELHDRVATRLPRGDEQRLHHLIEAGRLPRVPQESLFVARARLEDGHPGAAQAAAETGLGALELGADPAVVADLLEAHHAAALLLSTRGALDDHLHRLGRWPCGPRVELLERVARSLLHALDGQPERALDSMPEQEEAQSEVGLRCIVSARLFAARLCRGERFEAEIERAQRRAADDPAGPLAAAALSARAWRAYQDERYDEAGALHDQVARIAPFPTTRILALLNAASANLEAGRFDDAVAQAREAQPFARARRLTAAEARAEHLWRAAAYRRGDGLEADPELVRAGRVAGTPHLAGTLALTEAAIAWRSGACELARELAAEAARLRPGLAGRWHRLLARTLAAAAGASVDTVTLRKLLQECEACPSDGMAVQGAALLGRAHPDLAGPARTLCRQRGASVPEALRRTRQEILSITECMQ